MTFAFDASTVGKRGAASANPAKPANPEPSKGQISGISSISSPRGPDPEGMGYTLADIQEMENLLCQLAEIEGWSEQELNAKLSESRRMAPANVMRALGALRAAVKAELANWPEKPAKRALIVLCELV